MQVLNLFLYIDSLFSLSLQNGISTTILGLSSSNKFGGSMKSSCWSLFLSLYSKPLITLSTKLVVKSAFLKLFLIIFFSFVKWELIRFDLGKSPIIFLLLYFLGILELQGVGNLVSISNLVIYFNTILEF